MSNSVIKDVTVQTIEKRVVPGVFVTRNYGAHFSVVGSGATGSERPSVDVQFGGIPGLASSQTVGAADLRELATLFIQMADVMDGGE